MLAKKRNSKFENLNVRKNGHGESYGRPTPFIVKNNAPLDYLTECDKLFSKLFTWFADRF